VQLSRLLAEEAYWTYLEDWCASYGRRWINRW